jgi:SPP1 family predicted phage head-tail adaptor
MKDKPKIGDLRHLVSLQNSTNTSDGAGGFTQSYSTIADVFASINPKKGNEIFSDGAQGMQVENPVTHEIFIRYRDDVTISNTTKIVFGTREFNIRSILNLEEKNRFLKIEAEEHTAISA